jgi:hypothetical protein
MDRIALRLTVWAFGRRARYRLISFVYLNEALIHPIVFDRDHKAQNTIIPWAGIPNDVMKPVNWSARIIHRLFKLTTRESLRPKERLDPWMIERRPLAISTYVERPLPSASVLYDRSWYLYGKPRIVSDRSA